MGEMLDHCGGIPGECKPTKIVFEFSYKAAETCHLSIRVASA